jgi:regulator of sigma E protease
MKAGLKEGDEILIANGEVLHSPVRLMQIAEQGEGKAIELLVRRAGENIPMTLIPETPKAPENAGYMTGIVWDNSKGQSLMHPGPNPFQQVLNGATAIFRTIGSLFSSESDVSVRHMSSAVGIGNFYYQTLSDPVNGWRLALVLSVLINVNLGLLNLLPFPVLDGGHITMATYECIRKKPINLRFLEIFQTACALLLIGFMVYVTFYDVGDIVRGGETEPIRW